MLQLALAAFGWALASQCLNGPCAPGNDYCGEPFGATAPQYHCWSLCFHSELEIIQFAACAMHSRDCMWTDDDDDVP